MEASIVADIDAQHHVDVSVLVAWLVVVSGIIEGDKLHEIIKTVVNRQGRIFQDIGHVGLFQDVELTSNIKIGDSALDGTCKIGIDSTEDGAVACARCVDEFKVLTTH